ncbi:hypothetical protein [Arenimonas alkanexedens]
MGGWLRFWVVLTVLWGVLVAFVAYERRPKIEEVRSAWVSDGLNLIAKRISADKGVTVEPWDVERVLGASTGDGTIAYFERVEKRPKLSQILFRDDLIAINKTYRSRVEEIERGSTDYILKVAAVWIGPPVLLLILGYAVGWVRQGFRNAKPGS